MIPRPSYVRDYFVWSMNIVVLSPIYTYPLCPCDFKKDGLDTRPFTSSIQWNFSVMEGAQQLASPKETIDIKINPIWPFQML